MQQLACATTALAHEFASSPDQVARLLANLMSTFPDRIEVFLTEAQRVDHFDVFNTVATRMCAALPTKVERHAFRDQIVDRLSATELAAFDERMSAEWHRLRGK